MNKHEKAKNPAPGEVWNAWQPWYTHEASVIIEKSDSSKCGIYCPPEAHGVAVIPVNRHPALILAQGDGRKHGWLVCYFSTKKDSKTSDLERVKLGNVIAENITSYFFNTAPQYCPETFLNYPILTNESTRFEAPPQLRILVCTHFTYAMRLPKGQDESLRISDLLDLWFQQSSKKSEHTNPSPESVMDAAIGEGK